MEVIGKYEINFSDKVGTGSSSSVYFGYNKQECVRIAAKEIKISNPESAKREILLMKHACQGNSNIIEPVDVLFQSDRVFIMMELCDLGDLEYYMKNHFGSLSLEAKHNIMSQCASGVAHLHGMEYPILHGDIKPQSILVKRGDTPEQISIKIADFGNSLMLNQKHYLDKTVGTPKFYPPELFRNDNKSGNIIGDGDKFEYTLAVDVFALGLVFLILLKYDPANGNDSIEPYDNPNEPKIFYGLKLLLCRQNNLRFPSILENSAGDSAFTIDLKAIIGKMLLYDSEDRVSMKHVLKGINKIRRKGRSVIPQVSTDEMSLIGHYPLDISNDVSGQGRLI